MTLGLAHATIGNKIVERDIVLKQVNFKEQNNPHPCPSPLYSKLGCLLFFTDSLNSGTTLHARGMGEGKLYFLLLDSVKRQKSVQGKVSQLILSLIVATACSNGKL